MTTTVSVANQVATHLANLPILTLINKVQIAQVFSAGQDRSKVLSALEYYTANTGVSNRSDGRSRPKHYYAIKIPVPYAINTNPDVLYLSLPGIPRHLLSKSVAAAYVDQVIADLQAKYGTATIKYWCGSAQLRSVDFGRKGMNTAKTRDGSCRLCRVADQLCQQRGFPSPWAAARPLIACHIIARKTIFWSVLAEVEQRHQNIFTDTATQDFIQQMKQNQWHSDSRYIIGLCQEHDTLLQSVLTVAAA